MLYSDEGPDKVVMDVTGGKGVIIFISLWRHNISINLDEISLGQIDIRGSWSWNGRETWVHAVDLLDRGPFNLDAIITGHCDPDQWEETFENLRTKQDVKTFIHPHG